MKKQRKHYSPEEKVAVLRRHQLEKEPISKLCDELGLQPTVFCAGRRSSSSTVRLSLIRNLGRTIQLSRRMSPYCFQT